jgi:general secretion pathway protein I
MRRARGFTLIEVLVALVIVAFGMGAVLAALSSSADNLVSLRERTLAEWVAMNQIADARLNLTAPRPGVTEGDVRNFGGGNWHWRQDVLAVELVPGVLEIAVRVRRAPASSSSDSSSSAASTGPTKSPSGSSPSTPSTSATAAPSSFFGSSSGGLGRLSSSSGAAGMSIGVAKLPATADNQQWIVTVIGFRGDAIAPANGEAPDWSCNAQASGAAGGNAAAGSNPCAGSSSSGASSGGTGTTVPTTPGSSSGGSNPG